MPVPATLPVELARAKSVWPASGRRGSEAGGGTGAVKVRVKVRERMT
jgi:hypothetical protein